MPVETVFNTSPAKETPAPRRRPAEAGAAGSGEGFSLPETADASSRSPEPKKGAAVDGTRAATQPQDAKAAAEATAGKPGKATEPADATTSTRSPPVQPDSFIGTLAELLAAAQGQGASPEGEIEGKATGTAEAGEKGGKKAGENKDKKAEGAEAASADKDASDKLSGEAAVALVDQKPVPQLVAAVLSLSLPAAGGEKPDEAAAAKGGAVPVGAGPVAKAQLQAERALAAQAGSPDGAAGKPAFGAALTGATPGESSQHAGQAHKSVDADAAVAGAKADAAQGLPAQGPAVVAGEAKPAEAVQQALAPIDLTALVQQAVGGTGTVHSLSPLDQAAATPNPALPSGAGQAALPATPLHVVPIEIGLRALSGARQFDIRLDPDELGRVDVNLSISDKGEVSARLVVDRVETLHLLQRDARTLERAFEQAGLKPSDSGIDISLRDPSDQSAFRQHRQQEEAPQRSRQPSLPEAGDDAVLPTTPVPQRRLVRLGGVDLSI
ncbi:flagellar hook-length control protein FliK [Bosea sp. SSUT16]|uniref:Flagellar hook-length control protein FliK n=1 Tax=Bosea spartocytisi TaxID=2773451 RepID=A0A927EFT8_9HYPH|nr:flagellar hook-length control protein FliK [Bosea spartocytisi]MBD3848434.1 flagellar hook-length control protein FliK [Bosea spartocytisi]MCT4472783.1 flagellar hook-length control protein FliK [Bosea spartocytisi]